MQIGKRIWLSWVGGQFYWRTQKFYMYPVITYWGWWAVEKIPRGGVESWNGLKGE